MLAVKRGLVECTATRCSRNGYPHGIKKRRLIGKKCLPFFMPFFSGTKSGGEEFFDWLVITLALLTRSISTRSKGQRSFLCNAFSSLRQFSTSTLSHSGSHRKRIWSRMQPLDMIIRNLLTLVSRYQNYPNQWNCARS